MSEFHVKQQEVQRQEVLPAVRPDSANYLPQGPRPSDGDRAWTKVYDSVDREPSTAREVVKRLASDPQIKLDRLALLILAMQTVRRHEADEARRQRQAAFIRAALLAPFRLASRLLSGSAHLASDVLEPPKKEPANTRSLSLKRDPDFVKAKARFEPAAKVNAEASDSAGERSLDTKAA